MKIDKYISLKKEVNKINELKRINDDKKRKLNILFNLKNYVKDYFYGFFLFFLIGLGCFSFFLFSGFINFIFICSIIGSFLFSALSLFLFFHELKNLKKEINSMGILKNDLNNNCFYKLNQLSEIIFKEFYFINIEINRINEEIRFIQNNIKSEDLDFIIDRNNFNHSELLLIEELTSILLESIRANPSSLKNKIKENLNKIVALENESFIIVNS